MFGGPCGCGGEFRWVYEEESPNKTSHTESEVVVCKECGELSLPGSCKVCNSKLVELKGESSEKPLQLQLAPPKKTLLISKPPQSVGTIISSKKKVVGTIAGIEINVKFVGGDSSQTQKYKPIEVKNCKLDKNARAVLLDVMRERVLLDQPVQIRYQAWGTKAFNKKKDPIAIMTGGRFANICDILVNWGSAAQKLLAWHPDNHDRCVFIFVPTEIFEATCNLATATKLTKLFPNGLSIVGWEFESFTKVRYGFGAMRRAVLTFFRAPKLKDIYSGFWLLDDDTMIVPRTFDESEAFVKTKGPCIIGFTQGSTKRIKIEEVDKKFEGHQLILQKYEPSLSKDTLETVVLQQVVKYCGIHDEEFPSFHQGFICSGEDISFQRFLQKIGDIPVLLISGSIEKVELQNHVVIEGCQIYCQALNDALKQLYEIQNEHRRRLALSELDCLNQITCSVALGGNKSETMTFGRLIERIHGLCVKNGNQLNRSQGDITFLLVELLFCWNEGLMKDIPLPNISSSMICKDTPTLVAMRGMDIIRMLLQIGAVDIVELILSFL